jgi:hypothetical protein
VRCGREPFLEARLRHFAREARGLRWTGHDPI